MLICELVEGLGRHRQGLATAAQLRDAGAGAHAVSRAVAAGQVLRVRRGVYAQQGLAPLPEHLVSAVGVAPEWVRLVRADVLSLGGDATAAGRTAATLFGWPLLVEPSMPEFVVRHGRHGTTRRDIRVVQRRAAGRARLRAVAGAERLPVTSPLQTVLDGGRSLPFRQAVVLCDTALRSRLVTLPSLERAAAPLHGLSGARQLRWVLAAADARSESVLESLFRLSMLADGITDFQTQVDIHSSTGSFLLRADFCFAAQRLVVEVDGAAWHQDPVRDRSRDNLLAAAGWRVLRFTWADVVYEGRRTLSVLNAALMPGAGAARRVRLCLPVERSGGSVPRGASGAVRAGGSGGARYAPLPVEGLLRGGSMGFSAGPARLVRLRLQSSAPGAACPCRRAHLGAGRRQLEAKGPGRGRLKGAPRATATTAGGRTTA